MKRRRQVALLPPDRSVRRPGIDSAGHHRLGVVGPGSLDVLSQVTATTDAAKAGFFSDSQFNTT